MVYVTAKTCYGPRHKHSKLLIKSLEITNTQNSYTNVNTHFIHIHNHYEEPRSDLAREDHERTRAGSSHA